MKAKKARYDLTKIKAMLDNCGLSQKELMSAIRQALSGKGRYLCSGDCATSCTTCQAGCSGGQSPR